MSDFVSDVAVASVPTSGTADFLLSTSDDGGDLLVSSSSQPQQRVQEGASSVPGSNARRQRDESGEGENRNSSGASTGQLLGESKDDARRHLVNNIQNAMISFTKNPHWRWGPFVTDENALRRSDVCSKVVDWMSRDAQQYSAAQLPEHFRKEIWNLIFPLIHPADDTPRILLEQAIEQELWAEVWTLWRDYDRVVNKILSISQFKNKFGAWVFGFRVFAADYVAVSAAIRFVNVTNKAIENPFQDFVNRLDQLGLKKSDFQLVVVPGKEPIKKVQVINGPSGSGKSILSVQYAHFQGNNIVFLFSGSLAGWREDWKTTQTTEDTVPRTAEEEKRFNDEQRLQRNREARNAVVAAVHELLYPKDDFSYKKDVSADFTWDSEEFPHVVLVFDEIGPTPRFLRALCAEASNIAADVARILFGDNPIHAQRVHFIATGTGANIAVHAPGSASDSYRCTELLARHTIFPELVRRSFDDHSRARILLERLTNVQFKNNFDDAYSLFAVRARAAKTAVGTTSLATAKTATSSKRTASAKNKNSNDVADAPSCLAEPTSATDKDLNCNNGSESDDQDFVDESANNDDDRDHNDDDASNDDDANNDDDDGEHNSSDGAIVHSKAEKHQCDPLSWSPNEQLAADFSTNARAGTFLLRQVYRFITPGSKLAATILEAYSSYDLLLGNWLLAATTEFIACNGLKEFERPAEALRLSFVASVFRIPYLPLDKFLLGLRDGALPSALCTKGGILVDGARALVGTQPREGEYRVLDYFTQPTQMTQLRGVRPREELHFYEGVDVPTELAGSAGPGSNAIVADGWGRYKFASAQGAMARLFGGIPARSDHWMSLEKRFGEFGKELGGCSSLVERIMRPLEMFHNNDLIKFNKEVNEVIDPLFHFKQWLRFGEKVTGANMFELAVSGINQFNRFSKLADDYYRSYIRDNSRVVVLLSKEKEPFADVIFLGPGKVILLQVKRFTSADSDVDFNAEFLKMCAVKHVDDEEDDEEFLTKVQLVQPKKTASMTNAQYIKLRKVFEVEKIKFDAQLKFYEDHKTRNKSTMIEEDLEEYARAKAAVQKQQKLLAPKMKHHARRRLLRKLAQTCQQQQQNQQNNNNGNEPVKVYCGIALALSLPNADNDANKNALACADRLAKHQAAFDNYCALQKPALASGPGFTVEAMKFFCFDARNTNPLHPIPLYVDTAREDHLMNY